MPNYWIVVGSEENMRIAEARGFDIFGFKSTRRNEVAKMQPGDKLIFYLTKIMKFGGLAGVTSEYFEEHTKLFKSEKKPQEDYPFRVNVKSWAQTSTWPSNRKGPGCRHRRSGRRSTGASPSRAACTRYRRRTTTSSCPR